jgi:hypothetical protein
MMRVGTALSADWMRPERSVQYSWDSSRRDVGRSCAPKARATTHGLNSSRCVSGSDRRAYMRVRRV